MRFVFSMAVRETRSAWKRLLFFFVCIAIGVGAIVTLRSIIQSVRQVLTSQSQTLIAADVLLSSNRAWGDEVERVIQNRLASVPGAQRTDAVEMPTMVRPADESAQVAKVVELRAVQSPFPFYGDLTLEDGTPYTHALLAGHGALVRSELLTQLGVKVGDAILIGRATFAIRGVIVNEPGRSLSAFSLGPRVLIDYTDLPDTGLVAYGSRVARQVLLRIPDPSVEPLTRDLRAALRGQFVNVRSYRDREEQIGEDFERAENYLSLVGLVIVILGGIAVSSVTRVFVRQKIKSIAVMKCVGASTRQILTVYLLQALALGFAGSLIGVASSAVAIAALPVDFSQIGTLKISYGLTPSAVAQGVGIGVLVSLLFAMIPLLEIRRVKPSLLLRQEMGTTKQRDWVAISAIAAVAAILAALASWQAASPRVGASVVAGFAGVVLVLEGLGWVLTRLTRPLAAARWFPLRQAVLHLSRPGNQTRVILLTVGLGTFFIMGVRGLQVNLLEQFARQIGDETPDMFLLDIQSDQAPPLEAFLLERIRGPQPKLIPVMRARVTGRGPELDEMEDIRGRGRLSREYVITYRDHLEPNEQIIAGRFWDARPAAAGAGAPEVSIEERIRERAGINVGDVMRFDVLGRVIEAYVTSVRKVDWRDGRNGGFMFVFRPGALESAPHTYIAPVRMPGTTTDRARLEHDLVVRFPNVTVIDLREMLDTVRRVFHIVTVAISVVGSMVLVTGGLILIGAVAVTKFQRMYEAAIFKTLGASSRVIAAMLMMEYGLLGSLAGAVGSFAAVALGWGVSRYALDIPWHPALGENLASTAITSILVMVIGVVASLDVLRRKPLGTLRAE